jgi:hypothetical protein
MALRVRYCGASEGQLLGELRKWLARGRNVGDDLGSDTPVRQLQMVQRGEYELTSGRATRKAWCSGGREPGLDF